MTAGTAKTTELPKTVAGLAKEADRLRGELSKARTALALEKLDSPVKLRNLRRQLARALTAQSSLSATASTTKEKQDA